jgi:hypothetical protein
MKITQAGLQPPTVRRADGARSAASSGFASELAAETPARAGGAAPTGLVDALLVAQELPDALAERRKARARAELILKRLDDIRLGLLAGAIPVGRLRELAHMARAHHGQALDPQLREVLDEIELRAEVELAKLGVTA